MIYCPLTVIVIQNGWEELLAKWLLLPGLAILLAWAAAFGCYGWKALGA